MNKKIIISALSGICIMLSGCSKQNPESENQQIITGISLGMTKEEVFEVYGDNYSYTEDRRDYGYKATVEYGYDIDKVDVFDVDMKTQMFFEFENDETLVCYGYHIGRIGDYFDSSYPYSENELIENYDRIYEKLTEWYGESTSQPEKYADEGITRENSWQNEEGLLWFITGINMWHYGEPESYEKGCNEILVSCEVSE